MDDVQTFGCMGANGFVECRVESRKDSCLLFLEG